MKLLPVVVVLFSLFVVFTTAQRTGGGSGLACEQIEYTTVSQFSCIYPTQTFDVHQFPSGSLINGSTITTSSSITACLSTSTNGGSTYCSASLPKRDITMAGAERDIEAESKQREEEIRVLLSQQQQQQLAGKSLKTLPRYANGGGFRKQQQKKNNNKNPFGAQRFAPGMAYEEISARGIPADCYATVSFQWVACDTSLTTPEPGISTTTDLCGDYSVPEITRFPVVAREENVTCIPPGDCFCLDVPSASDFNLTSYDGVSIGLVLRYIENTFSPLFGLAFNTSCTGFPCIPIQPNTTATSTTTGGGGSNFTITTTTTGNPVNGTLPITTVVVPVLGDTSSSSSDLALILGLALGLGIPFLLCCILLIIAAIVGLLFLLGKLGKRPTAKTFWVPSRDDL